MASRRRGRQPPVVVEEEAHEEGPDAAAEADGGGAVLDVEGNNSSSEEDSEEEEEEEDDDEEEEEEEDTGGEGCVGVRVLESLEKAVVASNGEPVKPYLPTCPICMEIWASDGAHRVCCIPCGHVYGRSCLEKWLQYRRRRNERNVRCPQCGRGFTQKNIINLYTPEIVVPNNDLEKEVLSLKEQNESLRKENKKLVEEISEHKRQIILQHQKGSLDGGSSKRQKMPEHLLDETTLVGLVTPNATFCGNELLSQDAVGASNLCSFVLQNELYLDGARLMGIDASSQIVFASRRSPRVGGEHVLTKVSMFARQEVQDIQLPTNTKAIRDICILPSGCAVFASLGRRLSLFSMTTNSVVLQYDLPAPGWSCAGDITSSNHIYAGLQDGMVLVFDIRQTALPLHTKEGLSAHPVHTIHSVMDSGGSRKVLSASSIGPCMWDVDGHQSRPSLLPGMENQGVCISLARAPPPSDLLVASFRPRVEASNDATTSQMFSSQSPISSSGKLGCHTLIRRTNNSSFCKGQFCYGNVSELRMSKSAIIPCGNNQQLFAYGDESLHGVRTWLLPSFQSFTDLMPHQQPILDLRYAEGSTGERYLGCLSEDKLQIFRIR